MDKQREEYKAVFDMFDKDGDGTITTTELAGIFGKLGAEIDQDKLDILVKQVDANSDGCIDFEEFMQLMNELVGGEDTDDDLKSAFKIFDKDGNGKIDRSELAEVMKTLDKSMTERELDELMSTADEDGDGLIDFEEFKKMMTT